MSSTRTGGTTIEVTKQPISVREQTQLDSALTAQFSDYNIIIVAIDASQV
jgi:hypothetical protein